MQSKKSFFNTTIFKKNLTHFWPVWVLYSIFLIVMVPLRILITTTLDKSMILSAEEKAWAVMGDYLISLYGGIESEGTTMVVYSLIIGILAAGVVFSYMYKNRSSHMFHSLPVTRTELFFSNFIAGVVMLAAPLLLTLIGTVIVCILCGITALEYLFLWFLIMLGESFFFYSMSVLVGMFTGRLMAMPVFVLILNFLYIGCRYILTSLVGTISYGLSDSYANRQNSILSPIMYLNNQVRLETTGYLEDYMIPEFNVCGMKYVAIYAAAAVVFMLLAYLMYRRRNVETAGDLLSVKAMKPVFRWGVAACVAFLSAMVLNSILHQAVYSPMGEFAEVLITVCLVGFLAFFLVEMFIRKKIAVFSKKRFIECGVFVGLSALLVIGMECDLFGLERKIPNVEDVEEVRVFMYYEMNEEEPEDIEELMAIHKQIIDSKQEFEQYESRNGGYIEMKRVEFDYHLKNGDVIVRSYMVPVAPSYYKNADSVASGLYAIFMEPENYLKGKICVNYEEVRPSAMSFDYITDELEYETVEIPPAEALLVYHAYISDIKDGHIYLNTTDNWEESDPFTYANQLYAELYHEAGVIPVWDEQSWMGESSQYYGTTLELNTKCTNTIAELERLGYLSEERTLMTEEEYTQISKGIYGDDEKCMEEEVYMLD